MKKFYEWVLKNNIFVIFLVFVMLGISIYGITKIYIDNDVLHWFKKDSEIAKLNYYINEKFKSNNPIIIMISFDKDVFDRDVIKFIRNLSKVIKEEEGIMNVLSLTEAEDIKSTPNGIVIEKIFTEGNLSDEDLRKIRDHIMSRESFKGSLVSSDGKSINIIALPDPNLKADEIGKKIRSKVEEYIKSSGTECNVYFGGTPMILNSISKLVVDDISKLVPFVSLVVLLTLLLSFRTTVGTFLPLTTVLISCAIGMSIMGFLGYPLTTFGVAIPVVLIAVGNAYAIHVINEYYEKLITNQKDPLISTMTRVFIPILMSGLTTIASFISIGIGNDMNSTKNFATISALGVTFATLLTLTFVPATLSLIKLKVPTLKKEKNRFLKILSRFIFRYKSIVLLIFVVISILSVIFIPKIKVEVDYMGYFDKNSEPRIVSEKIAEIFDGSFELKTYIKGNIYNPVLLKVVQIIEEEERFFIGGKSKPQSIVESIAILNDGMTGLRSIPDTEYEVQNLWFFLEGNESVSRVVSDDKNEMLISLLLGKVSSEERYKLIDFLTEKLKKFSQVYLVPVYTSQGINFVSDQISKFVYNRLARAGIASISNHNISNKEEVVNYLKGIISNYLFSNLNHMSRYEEKKKFLDNFVNYTYETLGIDEKVISRVDLSYALSPSVWDTVPIPSESYAITSAEEEYEKVKVFEFGELTGIAKLFSDMEKQILKNQLTSLGVIIIIVLILNWFTFKSFGEGLISLIPIIFTLLVNFGIMGLFGIKMDFIMVTVASIAVGAGIDYTIHFISRYVYELKNGAKYEEGFYNTFSTTGSGILYNALAVGLGFATLLFSSIVPLRNFGLLMFVTMIVSSLSALTLLPIVLIYLSKSLHLIER